jgi:hypothetical protein
MTTKPALQRIKGILHSEEEDKSNQGNTREEKNLPR